MTGIKASFQSATPYLFSGALGFFSGLPLLLTGNLLSAWLREGGAPLSALGLLAVIGLPYSLKFLWAPFFDRFYPPFLGKRLGPNHQNLGAPRRGWLISIQVLLAMAIFLLSCLGPSHSFALVSFCALLVSCLSASQDILIDALRRESLSDQGQALGAAFYVNGYRLGMLVCVSGGFILADLFSFRLVYRLAASMMLFGPLLVFLMPEPISMRPEHTSMLAPFKAIFCRRGIFGVIFFILLYKLGNALAAPMITPFYLDSGYSKTEIGVALKLFGFWAVLLGGVLGGVVVLRIGIYAALRFFSIAQAGALLGYMLVASLPKNLGHLYGVVIIDDLTSAMGTAALSGFIAINTQKEYSASQFALLSGLAVLPKTIFGAAGGVIAESLGYPHFFLLCALLALPATVLVAKIQRHADNKGF